MGRGLSDLQRRILAKAIEGRAVTVNKKPDADMERFNVTLRVPLDAEAVADYFRALARYRRWKKEPFRVRLEIEDGEGDPFGQHADDFMWHDDTLVVLFCGLTSAVRSIQYRCSEIRRSLPGRLRDEKGWHELRDYYGAASESPAYVCAYDFTTREEAEAFQKEFAGPVAELPGHPGATLTVESRYLGSWPDLLVKDAVLLAGAGERTASAEAVASRAIARLDRRGLVVTGRARSYGIWFPRALWLTAPGLALAADIAPDVAERIAEAKRQHAEAQAAEEARRRAEREAWESSPEGQSDAAEAREAMREMHSLLAGLAGSGAPA